MPRPVKWSRDLHLLRNRAQSSKTETWSRQDIEHLFDVSRPSAQTLMKAIGEIQVVGAAHFVARASLLSFLDDMIAAESVEEALRTRHSQAEPPPIAKPIRVPLPADLRSVMIRNLPPAISLFPGRLVIEAQGAVEMTEALALLAQAMQNDLGGWEQAVTPRPARDQERDEELKQLLQTLRANSQDA